MSVATHQARSAGHHRLALCSAGSSAMFSAARAMGPRTSQCSRAGRARVGRSATTEPWPCQIPNQQSSGVAVCRRRTSIRVRATWTGRCPRAGAPTPRGDWSARSKYSIEPVIDPHSIAGCTTVPFAAATSTQGTSTSSRSSYRAAGGKTRAWAANTGGTREATTCSRKGRTASAIQEPGETSSSGSRPANCTAGTYPGERTTPGLLRGAEPLTGELHTGRLDNGRRPGGRVTVRFSLAAVRRTGDHAVVRIPLRTGGPSGRRLADSHLTSPVAKQSYGPPPLSCTSTVRRLWRVLQRRFSALRGRPLVHVGNPVPVGVDRFLRGDPPVAAVAQPKHAGGERGSRDRAG